MIVQSLSNDQWQIRQDQTTRWFPTQVPGCVHTTLMKAGVIPDPFVGDNEKKVQWVAKSDWEYALDFTPSPDLLDQSNIQLICDGLDTIAEVRLNDHIIGKTNDMFIQYAWDVKIMLKPGNNSLRILFRSPVQQAAELRSQRPLPETSCALPGGNYMRKAPCQFGWDWGPQLPPVGIWKDIRLEGYQIAKFEDVKIDQIHSDKTISLDIQSSITRNSDNQLALKVQLIDADGKIQVAQGYFSDHATQNSLTFEVQYPQLWFPNRYGEQNLYKLVLSLYHQETLEDERTFTIGLRTVELIQEKDEWGKSFKFMVNGVPIFAKGANWIPADSFPTRLNQTQLEILLKSAVDTHQNMLRVWGGGFYESDEFYELCDKYGILIWQDMIFSCGVYPLNDPAFLDIIKIEVEQNVKRLRHHPCLALWCGNNEMEQGWESWGWSKPELRDMKNAYDHFFHSLLPVWIAKNDKITPYWPSSPSSNTPFHNVNGEQQGDAHYWEVWHGRKPFTAYREHYPRFMSEFGFQSLPPYKTIETYAQVEDMNMTSYIMEHHQKNNSGNGLIIGQMTDSFRMPKNFSSLVYLSMVLQAEGIRYGVEHWRRNKHRVSGTLYWQLNDCWPVASWSSIDYYNRWKALHYAARHFYAPLMLSLKDEKQDIGIFLTSDLTSSVDGVIRWQLLDLNGLVLKSGEQAFDLAAYETRKILQQNFNIVDDDLRRTVFACELIQDGTQVMAKLATFVPNKHLELQSPQIEWKIDQEDEIIRIHLQSDTLARFVECSLADEDILLSDNYFDLLPGKEKTITILSPVKKSIQELAQKLVVTSLYDSFA